MSMKTAVILVLACYGLSSAVELSPKEIQSQKEGLEMWDSAADHAANMDKDEAIPKLGEGIRKTSRLNMYSINGTVEVAEKLKNALLAIPGHAAYYRDEINKARAKFEEALQGGDETLIGETRQYLAGKLLFDFPTLDHLPSVETVRVLGEFLSDERGYVKMPEHPTLEDLTTDVSGSPVFRRAAASLGKLPIVNKPRPSSTQFRTPDDVRPWKQWYEQIKAGNRTFRFEGDATEYDLNGPASKDTLVRVARAMKRDAERSSGQRKSSTVAGSDSADAVLTQPVSIAWILTGLALVAGAVWYFLRGRRTV